jgi:DNA repair exonuclease SbcCD ATPase subunit
MKIDKYKQVLRQLQDLSDNVQRCINGRELSEKKIGKYEKLVEKIKELESQLVGNSKEDFRKAVEIEKMRENIRLIQNEITRKKGTVSKLKETNKKLENDLPDLKLLEEALSNSGVDAWVAKEQAKMIENMVSKYMKLEVITVLENKTNDNTKEVFEIMKDGVSFRSMSFGERIKVSIAFGLVLRELIKGFNLPFVLLDEGSVLSEDTLAEIKKWLNEQGVDLIYTKASDTKLSVKKDA